MKVAVALALLSASLFALAGCDDPEVYMDAVSQQILASVIAFCHGYRILPWLQNTYIPT